MELLGMTAANEIFLSPTNGDIFRNVHAFVMYLRINRQEPTCRHWQVEIFT